MSTRFSAEEAQARLPELLDRAESGEEIVITRFGAPSAVLRRADSADGARRW
ncbi:type II toxin-antitoxin system prevent-host-death family antitoxin [Saccharopolyspora sp. SCSIO 74807]|uniref:type II toxin-antitoxin system Phd/YefM family antitoxin n=1 Tax=Saccharopolyspora sp. SCSIO 74807 TaxID=3118084 RepID=UPI0030D13B26